MVTFELYSTRPTYWPRLNTVLEDVGRFWKMLDDVGWCRKMLDGVG